MLQGSCPQSILTVESQVSSCILDWWLLCKAGIGDGQGWYWRWARWFFWGSVVGCSRTFIVGHGCSRRYSVGQSWHCVALCRQEQRPSKPWYLCVSTTWTGWPCASLSSSLTSSDSNTSTTLGTEGAMQRSFRASSNSQSESVASRMALVLNVYSGLLQDWVLLCRGWDWSWGWFELEVEVRLHWCSGWDEVMLKFSWSQVELSWYWVELGLGSVGVQFRWVGVEVSWSWIKGETWFRVIV